jgi:hypothetical protein
MTRRTPPFRRGGRPRKTDSEKRKLLISARVRQDELATIEGRADELRSLLRRVETPGQSSDELGEG